jgi:hypothetical protein
MSNKLSHPAPLYLKNKFKDFLGSPPLHGKMLFSGHTYTSAFARLRTFAVTRNGIPVILSSPLYDCLFAACRKVPASDPLEIYFRILSDIGLYLQ